MSITFKNLACSLYFCSQIRIFLLRFSFLLFIGVSLALGVTAQQPDSTHAIDSVLAAKDSVPVILPDSSGIRKNDSVSHALLPETQMVITDHLINRKDKPVSFSVSHRTVKSREGFFYLITGMVLLLGLFRYFFNRYFINLFRVFFNTSLRQSQLTDQLLQAKLPSLLFNLFFVLSAGVYAYTILRYMGWLKDNNPWAMLGFSAALIGGVYVLKYSTLKFTGWITGLNEATNTYVFVIFLINKIIGIFLVPFIVIVAFSDPVIARSGLIISLLSIGLFLLLRFFRSYGLLQNQLKISRFHFALYIVGIELVPLLLIYKGLMLYLSKSS